MKKALLILLFILILTNVYSQEKKTIYVDENYSEMTSLEFYSSQKGNGVFRFKFDSDTLTVYLKVKRYAVGRIKKDSLNVIREQLLITSNRKIDPLNTIVINYYPGEDSCNKSGNGSYLREKYTNYSREIKRYKDVAQFFIYKDVSGLKIFRKSIKWLPDLNRKIENNFFKWHYPCNSYVVIRPNGNYFSIRGEHDINNILRRLEDNKREKKIREKRQRRKNNN